MSAARSRGGWSGIGHGERRAAPVVAVAAIAVVVGVLAGLEPAAAAAVVGALGLVAVFVAVLSSTPSRTPQTDLSGKRFRWIAFAWAFLLIEPIGHFSGGRTQLSAVAGVPSVENAIELCSYGLIAASVIWSVKRNGLHSRASPLMFAFPTLALFSAAWSLAPSVTLAFSFELSSIVLLAILTAAIVSIDPRLGRDLVRRTVRITVLGIAVMCLLGLLFRGSWPVDPGNVGGARFSWPGGDPLSSAVQIGVAMLLVVFGGRRDTGFSWPSRAALLTLLGACLYLSNARTAFAGLAVAALFGYWLVSKGGGWTRRLAGAAAIAATVLVLVGSFGGPITQYLYRGESQQQVSGLNGRLGLWTIGLQQLNSPGRWLVGYGLNGTRVLFSSVNISSVNGWAGDAHSAWLELLLSLGLLGLVAGAALVVMLVVRLIRAPPSIRVLSILFVFVLAISPLGSGFAAPGPEPGLGFAVLGLCYAATARRQRATSRAVARGGVRLTGDLRPASI